MDLSGLGQGPVAEFCERGDETLVSTICEEFLDYVRNCQRLKKDPVVWTFSDYTALKCN